MSRNLHLTKHGRNSGPRWALDGHYLPRSVSIEGLLGLRHADLLETLNSVDRGGEVVESTLAPVADTHEVWASGVTYLTSREAREHESGVADVYRMVYEAERPELFIKSIGWRVQGSGDPIRVRRDSEWNVPEPELVLVLNRYMEVVGFTIGNDVSSRSIEGANPLYLPQAKFYNGSCSLGPGIWFPQIHEVPQAFTISLAIMRSDEQIFGSSVSTSQMKRSFSELSAHLGSELDFPYGVFLMTGTAIVPGDGFTLQSGDRVEVDVPQIGTLTNVVM